MDMVSSFPNLIKLVSSPSSKPKLQCVAMEVIARARNGRSDENPPAGLAEIHEFLDDPLFGLYSWNSSSDCCQWERVMCATTSESRPVIALYLDSLVLMSFFEVTTISSRVLTPLLGVTSLMILDISSNYIMGEIPGHAFANLTKLVDLDMKQNNFTGSIPPQVFGLRSLRVFSSEPEELSLEENRFGGNIPEEIGNLSKLQRLSLRGNSFVGGIPSSHVSLKELQFDITLKKLFLGGNNNLTWNNNNNAKIVPKCMLSQLSMKSFGLSGKIPGWISTHKSLVFLDLSENQLQGPFPEWLAEMDIRSIFLSDNNLSGSLPPRLFQTLRLSVLSLSRNNFSGELPENVGDAIKLMILMLAGNNFSREIPKSITKIYRLFLLDLAGNRFSGKPPNFDPDALLAFIDLSYNEFSGEIPVSFSLDARIHALGFSPKSPPSKFSIFEITLSRVRYLMKSPNLRNLRILDASSNNLTGKIPAKFGNLVGMIDTPNTLSSTSDLFTFSIEFNDLIVNWKKSKLGLSSHNLEIYSFVRPVKEQTFWANSNFTRFLKGSKATQHLLQQSLQEYTCLIPPILVKLQQRTTLDVSNNKLEGKIPVGGQMDTMNNPNYYANNTGFCGMQIQLPCPVEPPPPKPQEDENEEAYWVSWQGVAIGYPISFLFTVVILWFSGYFQAALALSQQRRRISVRQNSLRSIF
ncbi:hypothetical protein EZV62_001645 [Acer yangbiense]|uniref:Leucine-rich repeat-containing N-terminal plant-type domain-containing protein n=1 Tax=Acer yangbiense TaxID=1000413 RepID=A0A5C7IX34_9ROSI|nr:hypothetical protein EZV62_001645 [Acer yangbiense]